MRERLFFTRAKYALICSALALAGGMVATSRSQAQAQAKPLRTPVMGLDEIRIGMKGVGRTIFTGSEIEEFQVEILGVLKNMTPKHSVILARLSGGPLAEAGVVAGMSGSPVYIDGKLIGAVALGFQFSKEPIGGITPIEEMTRDLEQAPASGSPAGTKTAWQFVPDEIDGPRLVASEAPSLTPPVNFAASKVFWGGAESSLIPVATPLVLSGFTPETMQQFGEPLRSLGFVPMQGGGSGAGDDTPGDPSKLKPGSMISVQLIKGDMGISADGTVTAIDGNRIFAFGHPFLSAGNVDLPFAESRVLVVLPNYSSSMKLTTPGGFLGAIGDDRATGIAGMLGKKARTVPVEIEVASSRGESHSYKFEVVNDRFLLPFMMNLTLFSAIGATERSIGESTLQVDSEISVAGQAQIRAESFVSGSANSGMAAAQSAAIPIAALLQSGVGPLNIERMKFKVSSTDRLMNQTLEQVWTSKKEVRRGETVEVIARLRGIDGKETLQKTSVEIPENAVAGPLSITVADGQSMDRQEPWRSGRTFLPRTPRELIRAINRSRRNNRLYVRLARLDPGFVIQGETYPTPPPSVAKTLSAEASTGANISPMFLSSIAEVEMPPVASVVTGTRMIVVNVKD